MAFVLALVILSGVLVWGAGRIAGTHAVDRLHRSAEASAALHSAVLRSELEKYRLLPFALASDPDAVEAVRIADPSRLTDFDRKLEQLSGAIDAAAIYLIDSSGTTIAASNWNRADSFIGSNYAFRDYFRRAYRDGAAEQFALGTVSRHPGLYIARRIDSAAGGGVIVVKVEFDRLEQEWARSDEPAFVTDALGVVLVSSRPEWRFHSLRPLPELVKDHMRASLDYGQAPLSPLDLAERSYNGRPLLEVEGRSPFVPVTAPTGTRGWTLHLLYPTQGAIAVAENGARVAMAMALVLILAIVLFVARRRQRQRLRIEREAEARIALEREVEARTADVRSANRDLKREMSDRRASEARLQETREQLVQANKLASLGQITAGVAHEIAQPVAAIRSYADNGRTLLGRGRTEDAEANFSVIAEMTDRIGTITGELRSFSRKTSGAPKPMLLSDAIDGALMLLHDRIERQGVAVTVDPTAGLIVLAERVRLEQVLVNLLGNALDALRSESTSLIAIAISAAGEAIDLTISNNGPPIAADVARNLFRPFNSGKKDGLGLGLVISQEIMREFGGDLRFVPEGDRVVFRLTLRTVRQ
ncbi:sensor histidine kinase [Novosphingopyxis iocasae]|uniref:sensor histidine kinase n=1 Tax=Novosphingopyxis iocasae TaxID=2762729 RepID=UPI001650E1B7|nr:ATP-binding protein [Novosphingopyxis iocasae]